MDTCFPYNIDAALEKARRGPYRVDVIISGTKYTGERRVAELPWSLSRIVTQDRAVF